MEDELAKHSTPMYRAPEMLDTWSNFPINEKLDIWAAGCVLFCVCYNQHPFEDGNKLAIVNGNYRIPGNDSRYTMYTGLLKSMLTLDPRKRPSANQVTVLGIFDFFVAFRSIIMVVSNMSPFAYIRTKDENRYVQILTYF